ncbi:MAG: glutamate--tRNA ligase [Bradymonadaceae bacterium]|nr:glutamate--tRNA ligase [Lujinxingiaceae bacterium]
MPVRVRFAPSPTGYLHMGGARTALFNYLFARNQGGTFVLRIEDTDLERSKPEYTEVIHEALDWLGMTVDEGPYFQSQRTAIYQAKALELLEAGNAYKCFCTPEELEADRERALKEGLKQMYSRVWRDRRDHPEGLPFVVRIKAPLEGAITIDDMVQGPVTVGAEELDDFVILRSDGSPTYNFVVVIDDATMNISHVIRGKDHLNNTFRQIPVYTALGFDVPIFGHLPLIDGLSKRKGSMSVQHYRDLGYLQEAVINYISRLGWSHGDQEIFTMDELIEFFGFDHVGRSSGRFDDDKFLWVNAEWMKRLDDRDLATRWLPFLAKAGFEVSVDERLLGIVAVMKERAKTLVEMTEAAHYFFSDEVTLDEGAVKKWFKPGLEVIFEDIVADLSALQSWTPEHVQAVYDAHCAKHEVGLGKLAQPTRVSVTGNTVSPGLFETLYLLGRETTLARLKAGLAIMKERAAGDA